MECHIHALALTRLHAPVQYHFSHMMLIHHRWPSEAKPRCDRHFVDNYTEEERLCLCVSVFFYTVPLQ